jgi:RNA-binding protein YlmH
VTSLSIYHHFRAEERVLVERVLEWTDLVSERHQSRLTSFLDPREQFIVQSIVGRNVDVDAFFYGGYEQAERKRAIIVPNYLEVSPDDFQVTLLSVEGNYKSLPFEHRDLLGSVLGLGLKREKFGDLLLSEEKQQMIVAQEITEYVSVHLQQVSRYDVQCERIDWDHIHIEEEDWIYRDTTVSSLRLDVILSEILPFSRAKALPLIKTGKVKVNWKVVEHVASTLEEGDILSVKGYGRFLLAKIDGQTKKQKYRVQLGRKD